MLNQWIFYVAVLDYHNFAAQNKVTTKRVCIVYDADFSILKYLPAGRIYNEVNILEA